MTSSSLVLEFHVYVDPPEPSTPSTSAHDLTSCHATLLSLTARLAPRLRNAAWHNEPCALWLWDPADKDTWHGSTLAHPEALPAHIWGRIDVGESMDDEWFIVGLLLQLTIEQRDLSIAVFDDDGELLLIEAAYAIPRWLTPERAVNRVFLRRGELHIVPRDRQGEPHKQQQQQQPSVCEALEALRRGADRGSTRHVAATAAVRARTDPLAGIDCTACGPPSHGARALLPARVAKLLHLQPQLAAAAAAAFAERDAAAMRAVARAPCCASYAEGAVETHLTMGRCTYAKLMAAEFKPPAGVAFPQYPSTHPRHKAARLGARLTIGLELLLLLGRGRDGSTDGDDEREPRTKPDGATVLCDNGAAWQRFEATLVSRGYYRGELAGSELYEALRMDAARAFAASPSAATPPRVRWLRAQAAIGRAHMTTFRGQVQVDAVRLPSAPPPADSDEWLEMRENQLEESLGRRGAPPTSGDGGGNGGGDGGSKAASKSDAAARAQAEQLEAVAASVRRFVGGKGSAEGAQVPKAADVPVSLDVDRFMRALDGAFGRSPSDQRGEDDDDDGDESSDDEDDEEDDDDEGEENDEDDDDSSAEEEEGGDGAEEFARTMAQLDAELREKLTNWSFDETAPPDAPPAKAGGAAPAADGAAADPDRPVDLDFNLVKNLLASYSAQDGLAGPVSNLLGAMGLSLPEDADVPQRGDAAK